MLWAGDFNKHNPLWSGPSQMRRCRRSNSELLMQLLAQQHMELQLPAGTDTFQSDSHRTWTTIDLVFCDSALTPRILSCDAAHNERIPSADHLPIHTILDTRLDRRQTTPGRSFRNVAWDDFRNKLSENLALHGLHNDPIPPTTPADIDMLVNQITTAIQTTIQDNIPTMRISPYTKRWWNRDLKQLRQEFARRSRAEHKVRFTPRWEEHKRASNEARNTYIAAIRKAKYDHWKGWIEEATEKDIWVAGKYVKSPLSDGSRTRIPSLTKKAADGRILAESHTEEDKAALFKELFFPPRPHDLPALPDDSEPYPMPLKFTMPAAHQISRRIARTSPFKGPGEDGIPNVVLKECMSLLTPLLHACLTAILNLKYFPQRWRTWKTIVLRKPGRPDYTIAKAYRPIALYDTMGKIISGVMTDVTVYLTIRHNLLPSRHFGGLPNRTTVDSLLHLTHRVKEA
jgi:Endonuclease-reverse transcriptase